jgi:hypothetical protein
MPISSAGWRKRVGGETIEVPGSHTVCVSKPNDVARLIERVATASAPAVLPSTTISKESPCQ